jgi:hypothetical protein
MFGAAMAASLMAGWARADVGRISFMVSDETDPMEIAEDTALFVNGVMVAHFSLDATHPADSFNISIQAATHYEYALCGHITLRLPNGQTAMHVVDSAATLPTLNGRAFQLLAAANFTLFYMADQSAAVQEMPPDVHKATACSIPVS